MRLLKRKSIKNLVITCICQIAILLFGFLLPKLIVGNLGSEANGFLSAINEVFVYVALIEGGLGAALLNSLYTPLSNNDRKQVSQLLTAARIKYRTVAVLYLAISVAVGLIYPACVKSSLNYWEMCLSIIVYGLGGAFRMYFSSYITQYLIASGNNFRKEIIHLFIYVFTSISKAIAIVLFKNIIAVCLFHCLFCIVEGIIYKLSFHFSKTTYDVNSEEPLFEPLREQKYFLVHQISSAIFGATDLFIVSVFCSFNDASIYSVYSLVFVAINTVLSSAFNSLKYLLGDSYAKGKDNYIRVHDLFEGVYQAALFSMFWVAFILCNDFVAIYMKNADINYVDELLPLLFVATKIISCSRNVCNNTHHIAHRVKENIIPTILESTINICVSIGLVIPFKIYGVLLGTVAALVYRFNQVIIYTNKKILYRSPWKTYKCFLANSLLFILLTFIVMGLKLVSASNIGSLLCQGIIMSGLSLTAFLFLLFIMNKEVRKLIIRFITKRG